MPDYRESLDRGQVTSCLTILLLFFFYLVLKKYIYILYRYNGKTEAKPCNGLFASLMLKVIDSDTWRQKTGFFNECLHQ